jgi:hypothetical protein
MKKQATFGNTALARKMASRFGTERETVKVRMRYSREVQKFISKMEKAHKQAAKSKLIFG